MNKPASKADYVFTAESVTEGHPDKLCDQISDSLIDRYLMQDAYAQVVAECAVSTGILFVSVKAASDAVVDIANTAREVILAVGYNRGSFNGKNCTIMTNLSDLEKPLPRLDGVQSDEEAFDQIGAQESVTVFGYACTQSPTLIPLPIWLAHRLVRQLDAVRKTTLPYLAPDGKCQVGVAFHDHTPYRIESISLVTSQRTPQPLAAQLYNDIVEQVIQPVFAEETIQPDAATRIHINPEGPILEGGPTLHAGLTGRKNSDDTYGSYSRHSGAALSGKDPTRIDRIGAYAARHAAKNVVAAGLAERCEVQLSYSVGLVQPVGIRVETFDSSQVIDDELTRLVADHFDFRPSGIMRRFNLRHCVQTNHGRFFGRLAAYGHMGRTDLDLPWERTEETEALRALAAAPVHR
jgi:S-adenosylmethionine synthetase